VWKMTIKTSKCLVCGTTLTKEETPHSFCVNCDPSINSPLDMENTSKARSTPLKHEKALFRRRARR